MIAAAARLDAPVGARTCPWAGAVASRLLTADAAGDGAEAALGPESFGMTLLPRTPHQPRMADLMIVAHVPPMNLPMFLIVRSTPLTFSPFPTPAVIRSMPSKIRFTESPRMLAS